MKERKKEDSRLSEIEFIYKVDFFSRCFTIIVVLEINRRVILAFKVLYLFSSFIVLYLTFLNNYSGPARRKRFELLKH